MSAVTTPQTDLFGVPDREREPRVAVPYQRESATSREAAERARPRSSSHERDVYEAIYAAGERGLTRKELAARLPWADRQQNRITGRVYSLLVSRRVRELEVLTRQPDGTWKPETVRRDGSAVLVATAHAGRAR